jgi:hypothetical protein
MSRSNLERLQEDMTNGNSVSEPPTGCRVEPCGIINDEKFMTWNSNGKNEGAKNEGAMIGLVVGMIWLAFGLTSCTGDSSDSPPPAAPETVAGIDANGDGVRDDIEVYIDATYPVSTQGDTNRALRQFARASQLTMIDASEPAPSVAHAAERFRALECLMARRPGDFHVPFVELRARLLNTAARSLAYLQADNHVRAGNIPLLPADQWSGACL